MDDQSTRRVFLQKVLVGLGAAAAAATGFLPLTSRGDLLNQLAQHVVRTGYHICRYSKF